MVTLAPSPEMPAGLAAITPQKARRHKGRKLRLRSIVERRRFDATWPDNRPLPVRIDPLLQLLLLRLQLVDLPLQLRGLCLIRIWIGVQTLLQRYQSGNVNA